MTRQELCNTLEALLTTSAAPEERDEAKAIVGAILVEVFRALDAIERIATALEAMNQGIANVEISMRRPREQ